MSFMKSFNKVYKFTDADEAVECIKELYDHSRQTLLDRFDEFSKARNLPRSVRLHATHIFV